MGSTCDCSGCKPLDLQQENDRLKRDLRVAMLFQETDAKTIRALLHQIDDMKAEMRGEFYG